MAGREQPYDPYIPSGSSGQGGNAQYEGGNTRTAAIQSVGGLISLPSFEQVLESLRRDRSPRVSVR